jgi:hypothetical protein
MDGMSGEADATTYLENLLRAGLAVPPGDYWCPDGLAVPGDYPARAVRAGREPDPVTGGFWLAADLDRPPQVRWRYGWASLCGRIAVNPPGKLSDLQPGGVIGFGTDDWSLMGAYDCWYLEIAGFDAGWAKGFGPGGRDERIPAAGFVPALCEQGHETWPWLYSLEGPEAEMTLARDEATGLCPVCDSPRRYEAGTYRTGPDGMVRRS